MPVRHLPLLNFMAQVQLHQGSRSVFSPLKSEAWTTGMLSALLSDIVRVFILSLIEYMSKGPSGPIEDWKEMSTVKGTE